ncbi:MAG: hypothetical protein ACI3YQ_08080 [Prevotella sp.]
MPNKNVRMILYAYRATFLKEEYFALCCNRTKQRCWNFHIP